MNYGGNLHDTPENLMMMARAEDLDVVGEKVCNKDHRIFDHRILHRQAARAYQLLSRFLRLAKNTGRHSTATSTSSISPSICSRRS